MSAPIITCHLSPYVAIQGTAADFLRDAGAVRDSAQSEQGR